MNLEGFRYFEKVKFKWNKKSLNFKEIKVFPTKDVEINENVVFTGIHKGIIKIKPNCYFIHRGELEGELVAEDDSMPIIFGKIEGNIKMSQGLLDLRKTAIIKGEICCNKLMIEPNTEIYGTVNFFKK
ncbi:polymer-forming cytoskeletal protein [Aureivirga marina]|uniref:polymer-forming cytoskeletal protein n=1 Tax=Aureivirga marina TaxID=1182451 RepID=UPI0018CBD790|nr:polymer-forming cytoskeletal protein [Aureivirga marina]